MFKDMGKTGLIENVIKKTVAWWDQPEVIACWSSEAREFAV